MSYQAAGFNPNQTAIRSVQAQATGANDAAATAPVYQPIRYAKDLQAAQTQPETVNTATHTADAIAASATAAAGAAHSSGSSDQAQTQSAYATAQAAIDRLADYPEESESSYRQEALNKDVAHMLKCFYRETDGVELAGRYLRELARLNTTGMHPTCNCTPNT